MYIQFCMKMQICSEKALTNRLLGNMLNLKSRRIYKNYMAMM